jgi:hypothetical protein
MTIFLMLDHKPQSFSFHTRIDSHGKTVFIGDGDSK